MEKLNDKEEAFAKAFALNDGNASDAWRYAHPKSKAKPETIHSKASIMMSQEKVKARILQLKAKMSEQAEEKFSITVAQRLEWLRDITKAGMGTYTDQQGNARRENLAASRAAIATMNDMLGTSDGDDKKEKKSFSVTLRVEDASKPE